MVGPSPGVAHKGWHGGPWVPVVYEKCSHGTAFSSVLSVFLQSPPTSPTTHGLALSLYFLHEANRFPGRTQSPINLSYAFVGSSASFEGKLPDDRNVNFV